MSAEIETLHVPFAKFLREQRIAFIRARSDKPSTIPKGWPDFSVIHPRLGALLIEFKYKDGVLSKDQKECHAVLQSVGFRVNVIRDIGTAVELVLAWKSGIKENLLTPEEAQTLRRHGGSIWKKEPSGSYRQVRLETERDSHIPKLTL